MATFKNITDGPKGVNGIDGLVMIVAGTAEAVDVSDAELASAKSTGWFEIEGGTPAAEPGPLDQSVADLTAYLEGITDADDVQKLIDAETAGKSRKGALEALEARRDALLA
jgi:hypothetical protein